MLLRRITQHVKEQNWFAVLIDFVIVVFGVFMGFQVQQWNQERGNQKLEQQYLERLLADVEESIERTNETRLNVIEINRKTGLILETFRSCHLSVAHQDEFAKGIFDIAKISPSSYVTGTIEEMLANGSFSLLQSSELRDVLNDIISDAREEHIIFPLIHDTALDGFSQITRHIVFLIEGPTIDVDDIGWENIEFDMESMCQDKSIHSAVSSIRMRGHEALYFHNKALEVFAEAKSILENEIDQHDGEKAAVQ